MIHLQKITHSFGEKVCFRDFSTWIYPKERIGIIGDNGSGKSTLLHIVRGALSPTQGRIVGLNHVRVGFVPQTVYQHDQLSGGQRFHKALSQALSMQPHLLCLDEPTNHLDPCNRKALLNMLHRYDGTLIIATHDEELLHSFVDHIWHIVEEEVRIFAGSYTCYQKQRKDASTQLHRQLKQLGQARKHVHLDLMKAQRQAKQSREKGERKYENAPKIVRQQKGRQAAKSAGKQLKAVRGAREGIMQQLDGLQLPQTIRPTFSLTPAQHAPTRTILHIQEGYCGYHTKGAVHHEINLQILGGQRVILQGPNGSGKSTLLKAILGHDEVWRQGRWQTPSKENIGYLDQHYGMLPCTGSILSITEKVMPYTVMDSVRHHLSTFLFCTAEAVHQQITSLSGGEKCRLSLALIAARSPQLLVLDEPTNNLDLTTKNHLLQVLKAYPGALLLVSHDAHFVASLQAMHHWELKDGQLRTMLAS